MRKIAVVMAFALGWSLACSGGGGTTPPPKDGQEDPDQDPKPKPSPDAGKCANFKGVSLPLSGGVIVACDSSSVKIEHPGEDPKGKRWDYVNTYKKSGWMQGEPVKGSPTVSKPPDTLIFQVEGKAVHIGVR